MKSNYQHLARARICGCHVVSLINAGDVVLYVLRPRHSSLPYYSPKYPVDTSALNATVANDYIENHGTTFYPRTDK